MSDSIDILVVAAHPDDAELALGGGIAAWVKAGLRVTVACCSVSEGSPELAARRRQAAQDAAVILGYELLWVVPGDERQVENIPEYHLVGLFDKLVREVRPDLVISHWDGDSHGDHRRVAYAIAASARTWPDVALLQFGPNEHRAPSYGQFTSTVFVPMSEYIDRKTTALAAYSYEGQGYRPLDTAGVALRNRALGTQCGVEACEGLRLVRVVAGTRGARGLARLLTDL
ncbi:PIG-L deacetylase family protein [Nocardia sp. bgisy118]|uniref:PIG-L deacetylase family protein n=1 Tax=Nocardia sp. bgisy118 TaxID=3413786 RepID=UPI003F4A731C